MASIEIIKASDGSGNANVATVQSSRSIGASTIIVDTVLGINPGGFAGTMGTPHTFTDPITSETITVISEATAVDFTGHVDGSNLEIDDIAPGYTDAGSEIGDIVIIRPTTQWSDELADILEVAHNDDGTLKDDAVTTDVIADSAVTNAKLEVTGTTDANGWFAIDIGSVIIATKTGTLTGGSKGTGVSWSMGNTSNLPVGCATRGAAKSINYSFQVAANAFALGANAEGADSATSVGWTAINNAAGTIDFGTPRYWCQIIF